MFFIVKNDEETIRRKQTMSSVNKVILVGRLGQDPEVKSLPSGQNVATISVATSESWKDKDNGQKQEKTEWHRVVLWGRLADLAKSYLTKGKLVYIEGKLQTRSWDDKTGVKRYSTEIMASTMQFLGSSSPSTGASSTMSDSNHAPSYPSSNEFAPFAPHSHDSMSHSMPSAPSMGNFSAEELPF